VRTWRAVNRQFELGGSIFGYVEANVEVVAMLSGGFLAELLEDWALCRQSPGLGCGRDSSWRAVFRTDAFFCGRP